MSDIAVGLVRTDFSGTYTARRELDIRHYALAHRFELAELVKTSADEATVAQDLMAAIRRHQASIVIVPALIYVATFKADISAKAVLHTSTGETWARTDTSADRSETPARR